MESMHWVFLFQQEPCGSNLRSELVLVKTVFAVYFTHAFRKWIFCEPSPASWCWGLVFLPTLLLHEGSSSNVKYIHSTTLRKFKKKINQKYSYSSLLLHILSFLSSKILITTLRHRDLHKALVFLFPQFWWHIFLCLHNAACLLPSKTCKTYASLMHSIQRCLRRYLSMHGDS